MRRLIVAIPPITRISTLPHYSADLIVALPARLASSICAISYADLASSTRTLIAGPCGRSKIDGGDMPNLLIPWPPRFLRTPEAARFLGVSPRTLAMPRTA